MIDQQKTSAMQQINLTPATLLRAATGVDDSNGGMHMLYLCADACGIRGVKEEDRMESLQTTMHALTSLDPKDTIEGMLVTRLLALHEQGMKFLAIASSAAGDQVRDLYVNMATKLLRLHNESLDMLLRYRRKGEQRVVVQHVNVADGGKAIVGNVIGG